LAFYQQSADELGCNLLGGSGEEGRGECWESLVAMQVLKMWHNYFFLQKSMVKTIISRIILTSLVQIVFTETVTAAPKTLNSYDLKDFKRFAVPALENCFYNRATTSHGGATAKQLCSFAYEELQIWTDEIKRIIQQRYKK